MQIFEFSILAAQMRGSYAQFILILQNEILFQNNSINTPQVPSPICNPNKSHHELRFMFCFDELQLRFMLIHETITYLYILHLTNLFPAEYRPHSPNLATRQLHLQLCPHCTCGYHNCQITTPSSNSVLVASNPVSDKQFAVARSRADSLPTAS